MPTNATQSTTTPTIMGWIQHIEDYYKSLRQPAPQVEEPTAQTMPSSATSTTEIPAPILLEPLGTREVVDQTRALEIVAHWTSLLHAHRNKVIAAGGDPTTTVLCDRIRLSDKSYTSEAATVVANFLIPPFEGGPSVASGITDADLSDIIAGRLTEEGLAVLGTICDAFDGAADLRGADLGENAVGEQGIGACRTVLSKSSLERVSLCNNGLAGETMRQVADILTTEGGEGVVIARNLTRIHFFNNMSGEAGCVEFARILELSSKLVDVRFSATRAGRNGTSIMATALEASLATGDRNTDLASLDLSDNNFAEDESRETLFNCLRSTNHLDRLELRDCELEDDGTKSVCRGLIASGSAPSRLDLGGNDLSRTGARIVCSYLRSDSGKSLTALRLDDNLEITSRGVLDLAAALGEGGAAIEELGLSCTCCGDIGARALIDAYAGGANMPQLKKLYLNEGSFSDEMVEELEGVFGEKLEMKDNDADEDFDGTLESDDEEDEDVDDLADALAGATI